MTRKNTNINLNMKNTSRSSNISSTCNDRYNVRCNVRYNNLRAGQANPGNISSIETSKLRRITAAFTSKFLLSLTSDKLAKQVSAPKWWEIGARSAEDFPQYNSEKRSKERTYLKPDFTERFPFFRCNFYPECNLFKIPQKRWID